MIAMRRCSGVSVLLFLAISLVYVQSLADLVYAAAPTVTTLDPIVRVNSAELYGLVNPNGKGTRWEFEYEQLGYPVYTPPSCRSFISTRLTSEQSVRCSALDLTPSTTYRFRIMAINDDGNGYGAYLTFTTLRATNPPTVITLDPKVTATSAELFGRVNPNGNPTVWSISYGRVGQPLTAACTGNIETLLTQLQSQLIHCSVTGLTPSTRYHVQANALNADGSGHGDDITFTTPVFPG